jgi:serine/threonine protein kinase
MTQKFRVSDFVLIKKLTEGGLTEIYLAKGTQNNQLYVLRLREAPLYDELESDQQHYERKYLRRKKYLALLSKQCQGLFMEEYGYIMGLKYKNKLYFAIVTEYLAGYHDLSDYAYCAQKISTKVPAIALARLMLMMAEAVKCLHDHKLLHGDLKLENIMFNGKQLKMIDLDTLCLISGDHRCEESNITTAFSAPESRFKRVKEMKPGEIWSLGFAFYRLANGDDSYPVTSTLTKKHKVTKASIKPSHHPSQAINKVIDGILRFDPAQRPTIDQVIAWLHKLVAWLSVHKL